MMQRYIFCKTLEEGKAVKPWMSIVTFYQAIFTLCICNIFHLKSTKDFVQKSTKDPQYSKTVERRCNVGGGQLCNNIIFFQLIIPYHDDNEDKF